MLIKLKNPMHPRVTIMRGIRRKKRQATEKKHFYMHGGNLKRKMLPEKSS